MKTSFNYSFGMRHKAHGMVRICKVYSQINSIAHFSNGLPMDTGEGALQKAIKYNGDEVAFKPYEALNHLLRSGI